MEFLSGNSEALERLVVEMYTRGLSTRDVEECFRDEKTGKLMISRSAVSEITDRLWEDYREFCERDLSGWRSSTCSWTLFTKACAGTGLRRGFWRLGDSPPTGARCSCTWRWGTRSPRSAGRSS